MVLETLVDDWIQEEFGWCELGDERLEARIKKIVEDLAAQPTASLPQACEDLAALKATYRFLNNKDILPSDLLVGHQRATVQRLRQHPVVLALQDTVLLDFTAHPATQGLGPLASAKQQGLISHNTLMVTPERLPLGIIQQQVWIRDESTYGQPVDNKKRSIDEKESQKWLTSLEGVIEIAPLCPMTQLVSIGDSEADVYDLFLVERPDNVKILIRACQDRRVEPSGLLMQSLEAAPVACTQVLRVPRRNQQKEREAHLTVRFKTLTLRPPKSRASEQLKSVSVGAILIREEHPPADTEAIEWLLLTTLPVEKLEQALQYVRWYCVRWQIEVWHKVLKSGCRIESRQLSHSESLQRCLALYSVIAWRIMYATMLCRSVPNASCEIVLEKAEWQALYCHVYRCSTPPSVVPSLQKATEWIAQLGGYLGRSGDGPPGITVIWRGLQRLHDLTAMYIIMTGS